MSYTTGPALHSTATPSTASRGGLIHLKRAIAFGSTHAELSSTPPMIPSGLSTPVKQNRHALRWGSVNREVSLTKCWVRPHKSLQTTLNRTKKYQNLEERGEKTEWERERGEKWSEREREREREGRGGHGWANVLKSMHQTNALLGVWCVSSTFTFSLKDKKKSRHVSLRPGCLLLDHRT